MTHVIYAILDPRDKAPIYVGNTDNFEKRKQRHLSIKVDTSSGANVLHLQYYIGKLLEIGQSPAYEVLETLSDQASLKEIEEAEIKWVEHYVEKDQPLLNNWVGFQKVMNKKFSAEQIETYFKQRLQA